MLAVWKAIVQGFIDEGVITEFNNVSGWACLKRLRWKSTIGDTYL